MDKYSFTGGKEKITDEFANTYATNFVERGDFPCFV